MKKTILILLSIFVINSQANPKFGITGASDGGIGVAIYDNLYTGSILYSYIQNQNGFENQEQTNLEFNGKYKFDFGNNNKLTVGAKYIFVTDQPYDDQDSDENSVFAITAGFEHAITNKFIIFGETDAFRTEMFDDGQTYDFNSDSSESADSISERSLFSYARLGIIIVF